ncbi:MAG: leucine-rich repeat domain-containing protein, partial [Bacteroidota bacterium]
MEKEKPEQIKKLEEFYGVSLESQNFDRGYRLNQNGEIVNLYINAVGIKDLAPIAELTSLQYLELPSNQIKDISSLSHLKNLTNLNISRNQIEDLTPLIHLNKIESLSLQSNPISSIGPIKKLNLRFVSLGNNNVEDFFDLKEVKSLKTIHVLFEKNSTFSTLGKPPELKNLRIYGSEVNRETSFLNNFKGIEELKFHGCKISSLQDINKLQSLTKLGLHDNQIEELEGLEKLKNLHSLDLSRNKLRNINTIGQLKGLNQLELSYNQITDISALKSLEKLNELSIHHNLITSIQAFEFIIDEQNFKLIADGNPCFADGELILDAGQNHFDAIKNELLKRKEKSNEYKLPVKVLALGNHASGKSTLIEYIQNEGSNKRPIEHSKSTHIVKIETYPKTLSKGELPKAVIYDFGGQDYYHGIYRAFLSNDSINLLLWNKQNDQNQIRLDSNGIFTRDFSRDYWLHQLHYQYSKNKTEGESEPILMIQSYADLEGATRINYKGDNSFFNIVNEFYISLHRKSISKSKVLQSSLKYLDHSLKELIESKQRNEKKPEWFGPFINYIISASGAGYTELSEIQRSYLREENKQYLPEDLDQLAKKGLLLYYKDDPDLKDIAWLSPSDTVKHIHDRILSKKIIQESGGIVKEDVFKNLVNDEKLLKLLLNQKVVFHDVPYKNYIIPSYLKLTDDDSKIYELLTYDFIAPTFVMKFEHFIPLGLINQLICYYGKNPDKKYY